jgi:Flp pilus assembly pilin Flp
MSHLLTALDRLVRTDDGQDLTEYGVLAALIACFAIGALTFFGTTINNTFWSQVVQLAQNI